MMVKDFKDGEIVIIKSNVHEFYLNNKPTGMYVNGVVQRKIDDDIYAVKLLNNGESHAVRKEWLEQVKVNGIDIDKLIKEIVYMIFEDEVDLNDPSETIEQVMSKLYSEGMYSYKNEKGR